MTTSEVLDSRALAELKEMLEDAYDEYLESFYCDIDECIEAMRKALSAQDAGAFGASAHAIKSICGYVGAKAVAELAQTLEFCARDGVLIGAQALVDELETGLEQVKRALEAE